MNPANTPFFGLGRPDQIVRNLWQGGVPDATTLDRLGITAIINMDGYPYRLPQGRAIKCLTYEIDDGDLPDIDTLHAVAKQGFRWLRAGERLLVHCAAGWNRSGLTNGLILIMRGMKGTDAVELIKRKRQNALGNAQFRAYLSGYEDDPTGQTARLVEPFQTVLPLKAVKARQSTYVSKRTDRYWAEDDTISDGRFELDKWLFDSEARSNFASLEVPVE